MFADADICVKNKATEYLIGCAISCIFLSLYMGCVAVFRGIGQTKICLKLSMIINLIHLFASFNFYKYFTTGYYWHIALLKSGKGDRWRSGAILSVMGKRVG